MGEREHQPKLPITSVVLKRILEHAYHSFWLSQLNFEAAITTAFSGFLRCGEFTIQSGKPFDPSIHLMRSCINFVPSISAPLYVVLTVPSSMTDPFTALSVIFLRYKCKNKC